MNFIRRIPTNTLTRILTAPVGYKVGEQIVDRAYDDLERDKIVPVGMPRTAITGYAFTLISTAFAPEMIAAVVGTYIYHEYLLATTHKPCAPPTTAATSASDHTSSSA